MHLVEGNLLEEDNLAQSIFSTLVKASKATRKTGYVEGGVTYTRDLINKRVTGSFVFALEETTNEETGEVTHKIADSLQLPTPESTTQQ